VFDSPSEMSFTPKSKHKVLFVEAGKPPTEIGYVTSFNEDSCGIEIGHNLYVKLSEVPRDLSSAKRLYLGFRDVVENHELVKLHSYLIERKEKKVIKFDLSKNEKAFAKPLDQDEVKLIKYPKGFALFVPLSPAMGQQSISTSLVPTSTIPIPSDNNGIPISLPFLPQNAEINALQKVHIDSIPAASTIDRLLQKEIATASYNQLERFRGNRHLSNIFHIRNFNNFIKMQLIQQSAKLVSIIQSMRRQLGLQILDLACGKGGDLGKWLKNSTPISTYCGVDIALDSLKELADNRIKDYSSQDQRKLQKLIHCDISQQSLKKDILPVFSWKSYYDQNASVDKNQGWCNEIPFNEEISNQPLFHLISCQFALHYFFYSEKSVRHVFSENIGTLLEEQGCLIATTIDSRILAYYCRWALYGPDPTNPEIYDNELCIGKVEIRDENQELVFNIVNEFKEEILQVRMLLIMVHRLLDLHNTTNDEENNDNKDENSVFGIEYCFSLFDSKDSTAVNAPEWIVPLTAEFYQILKENNLHIIKLQNFHEFFHELVENSKGEDSFMTTMSSMNVLNTDLNLSKAEWSIARMYVVIVFIKSHNGAPTHEQVCEYHHVLTNRSTTKNVIVPRPHSPTLDFRPVSPESKLGDGISEAEVPFVDISPSGSPPHFSPHSPDDSPRSSPTINLSRMAMRWISKPPLFLNPISEEEDAEMIKQLQLRQRAIELAGGEDIWDNCTQSEIDYFMKLASQK
jgi:SAM-dependent methyltransferase